MKVLLLVGSGDKYSHSLGLGQAIQSQMAADGADVELVNLVEYALPLYNRSVERADQRDAKTAEFLTKSYAADAFVWVTPIYHNSFSSLLKNALDWQHTKFPGKTVGLASNGGDRSPQAVDQLMLVARAQHLIDSPIRVCTQEDDFYADYKLISESILARINDFSSELISLTKQISK